jgi:hypothetical protein
MNRMKLGGGGRFAAMVASGKSPALAASIGRKKYGSEKMEDMAAAGRKRKGHSKVAAALGGGVHVYPAHKRGGKK